MDAETGNLRFKRSWKGSRYSYSLSMPSFACFYYLFICGRITITILSSLFLFHAFFPHNVHQTCSMLDILRYFEHFFCLRWEFIKENKKVRKQENKKSPKKAIKKTKKQELDQESDQENKKKLFFSC